MKKTSGGISILVLFVFLIITFILLYLLMTLEQRISINKNMYDGLQSSYYSESVAYLAEEGIDIEKYMELYENSKVKLEAITFSDGKTKSIELRREKYGENNFTNYLIEVEGEYKRIPSRAIIKGSLVDPIFFQEDGLLLESELINSKNYSKIIDSIKTDFFSQNKYINGKIYTINESTCGRRSSTLITFSPLLKMDLEQGDSEEVEPLSTFDLNKNEHNVLIINDEVQFQGDIQFKGLIIVRPGGKLNLENSLSIEGVCIVENEGKVGGMLNCKGLCINLSHNLMDLNSTYNTENIEKYLYLLDGFVNPNMKYLKKE